MSPLRGQAHIVGVINATVVRFPSSFQFSVVSSSDGNERVMEKRVTVVDVGGWRRHFAISFSIFSSDDRGATGHLRLGYKSFAAVVAMKADAIFPP